MFEEEFNKMPVGDQSEFARVVNGLLLHSFVVRDIFDSKEKMMKINPDYRFIERYYEIVSEYLKFSGWNVEKDVLLGVVSLVNEYSSNRLRLDRETSLILFAIRLIYEEQRSETATTGESIYMTTPSLIKLMIEYGVSIPGKKLSGRLLSRSLRLLEMHHIISKVSGSYDEGNVSFYILPSIVYAVDQQKIVAMSEALDKLKEREEEESASLISDLQGDNN